MGVQDVVARLNKTKVSHVHTSPDTLTKKKTHDHLHTQHPKGFSSVLHKFNQTRPPLPPLQKPLSPPESPVKAVNHQHQIPVAQRKDFVAKDKQTLDMTQFDIIAEEICDLYQLLLNQNEASKEYISKLQKDVETYSSDSTKVRDYEIRVEYLALKLEQVSEERENCENELNELRAKELACIAESPLSPAISQVSTSSEHKEQTNIHHENYMADILNVYEEISEGDESGDELLLFEDEQESYHQQQMECDRAVQMTLAKYVCDLEQQRLETKALKEVVKKQDELINKLEHKITTETDQLLKEQVYLQTLELEDKRELLNQLLNEREDLLRRVSLQKRLSSRRSSIDLLGDMAIQHTRPSSLHSLSSLHRTSLPITAPPKHPLPPAPSSSIV